MATRWKAETGMLSSVSRKIRHPAYQKIIELGVQVIPLILREMRVRPAFWFAALEALTGVNPAKNAETFEAATEAWLKWGRESGYFGDDWEVSYH